MWRSSAACWLLLTIANGTIALQSPVARAADELPTYELTLPRQPLDSALQQVAHESGTSLFYFSDISTGLNAPELRGRFTLTEALTALLAGSDLTFRFATPKLIEIRSRAVTKSRREEPRPDAPMQEVVVNATATGLVATRTETRLQDIPQTLSIISQVQMREQHSADLGDVMERAVGVTSVARDSLLKDFDVRGYRIESVHLDGGASLNSHDFFNSPLPGGLDLAEFERVEVLRGADALFGSDNEPGGSVNMIRKRPLSEFGVSLNAWGGSWNDYRVEADVTGPVAFDGALRARANLVYQSKDYFFDMARLDRRKAFGVVEYGLPDGGRLTVGGSIQREAATPIFIGLPLNFDGSNPHRPRHEVWGFDWSRVETRSYEAYAQFEHRFGDTWKLKLDTTWLGKSQRYEYGIIQVLFDPNTLEPAWLAQLGRSDPRILQTQLGLDATLTGAFDVLGRKMELALGWDLTRQREHLQIASTDLSEPHDAAGFDFDPSQFSRPDPETVSRSADRTYASRQSGVFVGMRAHLTDSLSAVAGTRVSFQAYEVDTAAGQNPYPELPASMPTKAIPYGALLYDLNDNHTAYVSYADVYAWSALQSKNGSWLGAADGAVTEVGLKGTWRNGTLNGALALYRIRQTGLPIIDESVQSDSFLCCFTSSGSNSSKGVDVELTGSITPAWLIGAGYTLNQNHSDETNAPHSAYTPKHLLKVWTRWTLPGMFHRISLGGDLHAQSKVSSTRVFCCVGVAFGTYTVKQSSYAVVNARAGFQLDEHWQLALNVDNVFDRVYFHTISQPVGGNWYGQPRSFMIRVSADY